MDVLMSALAGSSGNDDNPELKRFVRNFKKIANKVKDALSENEERQESFVNMITMITYMPNSIILKRFIECIEPWSEYIEKGDDSFIKKMKSNSLISQYEYLNDKHKKVFMKDIKTLFSIARYTKATLAL